MKFDKRSDSIILNIKISTVENINALKVEPLEQVCVGPDVPKLGNTNLLNGK